MSTIDLNAPEVQAAISAAVEEAVSGLKTKNNELLTELRKAKKGNDIDPAEVERLENKITELEGQIKTANKELKTAKEVAEKATKDLQAEQGFTTTLLKDNGLTDALTKAGVTDPINLKAARAMLGGEVMIVADGDKRVAKVGDKPLADHINEWAKTDEGKRFVAASGSSGGGSGGGGGGGGGKKTMTRSAFDALDAAGKATAAKDHEIVDG
jgi:seryl-tRNA synthetase